MAKTQATTTPLASGSIAAATDGTGSVVDVTAKALATFRIKVTAGATAPTVQPSFRILSSTDNTNFDADVNGMRFYEKEYLQIPAANGTYYKDIQIDCSGMSYLKPIVKNEDAAQAVTMEIVCVTTTF